MKSIQHEQAGGDRTGPLTRKVVDGSLSIPTGHRRRPGDGAFIRDRGRRDVQLERATHREPHHDSRRSVVRTDDGCRALPAVAVSRRSLVAAAHRQRAARAAARGSDRPQGLRVERHRGRAWGRGTGGLWIALVEIAGSGGNPTLPDVFTYPPLTIALGIAMGSLVSPLSEEAAFRGYAQTLLERVLPAAPAIATSSVLFALWHGPTQGFVWNKLLFFFVV